MKALDIIYLWCILSGHIEAATRQNSGAACSVDGNEAGQALVDWGGPGAGITANTAYLMIETGTINCYGMVSTWRFYKDANKACDTMMFHIWRVDDEATKAYWLVGHNMYDPVHEGCNQADEGIHTLGIAADRQIPVEPGDIIGWSVINTYHEMISHRGNAAIAHLVSQGYGINTPAVKGRVNVVFDSGELYVDISLQATINRAPPALFSTLPREQMMQPGIDSGFSYLVDAVHSGNLLPQQNETQTAMYAAVKLKFGLAEPTSHFSIATDTGILTSNNNMEFEPGQVYELPVTVTAMALTSTATLTVTVMDYPGVLTVIPSPDTIVVSALDKIMHDEVYRVHINNTGSRKVGTVQYHMGPWFTSNPQVQEPPPFYVDENTGVVRCSQNLSLFVANTTTIPQSVEYTFEVIATDNVLHDSAAVTIRVEHLRQRPRFINLPGGISIDEDQVAGQEIFPVYAESPSLEELSFSLIDVIPQSSIDFFMVDPKTGSVSLTEANRLIRNTRYEVTIGVRDLLLEAPDGVLTISVDTVNQAPSFQFQQYQVTIPEKCNEINLGQCASLPWQVDSFEMNVIDRESNAFTCPSFPLQTFGSQYFAFNATTPCSGVLGLQVIGTIDVDSNPSLQSINLTLTLEDQGFDPVLETMGYIHITVTDINDHAPHFTESEYVASVEENRPGGVSLLTISATDQDLSYPNSNIKYTLPTTQQNTLGRHYFQIDPIKGILSTKQPIDFELHPKVEVDVSAEDHGSPPQFNTTTVTVFIQNVNDNHPEFQCQTTPTDDPYPPGQMCFYNLELRSDTPIGHRVIQLVATDNDSVTTDPYYFLLKSDLHFALGYTNGLISTRNILHNSAKYILYCYAESGGKPNLLSQVLYVRIDSYPPKWHLIDITLEIPLKQFDRLPIQFRFLEALRLLLSPWHVKMESYKLYKNKTKVTIYALEDNSTYSIENMNLEKKFVHRNSLLPRLRKNIHGTPSDDLLGEEFDEFDPIRVMPTFPIWWIDTVEGIATICVICFLFISLCISIAVLFCKKYQLLSFKKSIRSSHAEIVIPEKSLPADRLDNSSDSNLDRSEEQMKLNYAIGDDFRRFSTRSYQSLLPDSSITDSTTLPSLATSETSDTPPIPLTPEGGSLRLRTGTRAGTLPPPPESDFKSTRSDSLSSIDTIHTVIYDRK